MSIEVLYRDALMLAINKPSGLPVHKGAGRKIATLEDYLDDLRFGLPKRPELAHRLDKDTTGCLILGRNKVALKRLSELFQQHLIEKTYIAIAHGVIENNQGEINLPIAKKSRDKKSWWGKIDDNGQPSLTHYEVLARSDTATLVKLIPITGRTHQLRIHLQALGYPIVGDQIYGQKDKENSLCLHCYEMNVPLYAKKEKILLHAPLPENFVKVLDAMKLDWQDDTR
ncbi:MAG: RluA family pseudouridine synthase [Pseudomonadota bacterium]|jgi:tRNA pseudouridine32 synthase/23S rRNA pseudouridine746 synthase|nr:RluA family pseudouridine synthase [Alphaproteobacteria bacterium]